MDRRATSADNPWMYWLKVLSLLGVLLGGAAVVLGLGGFLGAFGELAIGPWPLMSAVVLGAAVFIVSWVGIVAAAAVSAHLWELKNPHPDD